MSEEVYHIPALLPETLEALNINPEGIYVDVTYGGGGHSRAIMEQLNANGHLYSFDQDEDAVKRAMVDPRFTIVYSNFRFLSNFLEYHKVEAVDGILGDLGVSFHHFDDKDRGFSFRFEGALDMRMNQKAKRTAAWIVMNYSEEQLADVFYLYGELKNARKLASTIVKARNQSPIETVERLLEVVKPLINPRQEKKELAMLFQALRIEVNGEIDVLKRLLQQSLDALKPGGRLAIITYHSLEDRLVKNFMRSGNLRGELEKDFFGRSMSPFKLLTSKPIVPSDEEIELNPRSRSAKLRVAQKL
ncbi:MAG: 16S rRNA (cytosine(1402)-N(4))-methyltransferase RsmH [Muribaculaceae bacterium]|jgi:16S rRNA (cytosine1402-N4)-methyltransferase|nr:16S rRNA (cytosine(1402)-N(4))-methyltransferase RsmH [Muribaculaceae bacterium]MBR5551015.1 16S rRNA (cytosine(1402)-N(4))-methyltransferase RsmH [Muribaculaceae bacterium]